MVEASCGRRKNQRFFIPVWTSSVSSRPSCVLPPICLSPRGCTHTLETNGWLALSPRLSCPVCEGRSREMSLWDAGEASCGQWMTHLTKGPQGWLEKATLKWLVVLGGHCGLAFLLLLTSFVISHLPSPCIAAAGLSDPEQRLGPIPVCLEIRSCHS